MGRQRTLVKYLLLQVPGWILLVGVLWLVRPWVEVPGWAIAALLALWIVKDLALYPFLRHSYEEDPRTGAERLVGARGVVSSALAPRGYIRVGGELWQAEARGADGSVPEGRTVRVCAAKGMTLIVERD